MSSSPTFLCIVLCIVFVDSLHDVCYSDVDIRSKYSNSTPDFQIFTSSSECVKQLDLRRKGLSEPEPCPPGLLSVDLSAVAGPPPPYGQHPHAQFNISVISHSEVTQLFIRLECIYAPDGDDIYCHDDSKMMVNGVWLWPCRGVSLGADVDVPLAFGYSCFRIYGFSQYLINVTVFPQNCRNTFLITAPNAHDMFPKIADFYGDKASQNLDTFMWAPVLFADLSESDGLWLRIAYPEELARTARLITIAVYKKEPGARWVQTFELSYPQTGVKWFDVPQGDYNAYAYVKRHDCSFPCPAKDTTCTPCKGVFISFSLPNHLASFTWKARRYVEDGFMGFVVFVGALLLLCACGPFLYTTIRRLLHKPRIVAMFPMQDVKKVYIVYSDECEEHANVVWELTKLMEASGTVKVLLDQRDLLAAGSHGGNYTIWLTNSMREAEIIFLVVSPCTEELIEGRILRSKRPYPDLFKSGYDIFLAEWNRTHDRLKLAIVRLPYSPTTPRVLAQLNLHEFYLPKCNGELMLFLKGETPSMKKKSKSTVKLDVDRSITDPLEDAVVRAKTAMEGRTNWDYLSPEDLQPPVINLALAEKRGVAKTVEEQKLLAERLGIEAPDTDEEGEDKAEAGGSGLFKSAVVLLPPDSDSADSD